MKLFSLVLLLAILAVSTALANSMIYKWVDKNGHVHYSTVPHNPSAKPMGIINTADSQAPAATSAPSTGSTSPIPVVSPNDSPACRSAKQKLGTYLMADRLYSVNAQGKKTLLSKEKRTELIQLTRNQMTEACSKPESPP